MGTLTPKGAGLRQLSRFEEGLPFDQTIALDPNYGWASASKGEALREKGRLEDALTTLDRAVALEADSDQPVSYPQAAR